MASIEASGYDFDWVEDPPDDLKCQICLCVARDPQQHPGDAKNQCGKVFCNSCITEYRNKSNQCPNCRQELTLFQDSKSARAIKALKVKCANLNNGCNRAGELGSLVTHRSTCPYEPMSCKYAAVGCEEKPLRKDLTEHEENDQLHLRVTIDKVLELTQKFAQLEATTSASTESSTKPRESNTALPSNGWVSSLTTCTHTLQLCNYQERKQTDQQLITPPFYTSSRGYKICLKIFSNGYGSGKGNYVSVFAFLTKGDHDDTLTWPFTGSVTFELLNQLEDKNHHKKTLPFPADQAFSQRVLDRPTEGIGIPKFIPHADLNYNAVTNTQYLKNDTLAFRFIVHVPHLV